MSSTVSLPSSYHGSGTHSGGSGSSSVSAASGNGHGGEDPDHIDDDGDDEDEEDDFYEAELLPAIGRCRALYLFEGQFTILVSFSKVAFADSSP